MLTIKYTIDDESWTVRVPDNYKCNGRLGRKNNKPGVWTTKPSGKELFILATQDKFDHSRKTLK